MRTDSPRCARAEATSFSGTPTDEPSRFLFTRAGTWAQAYSDGSFAIPVSPSPTSPVEHPTTPTARRRSVGFEYESIITTAKSCSLSPLAYRAANRPAPDLRRSTAAKKLVGHKMVKLVPRARGLRFQAVHTDEVAAVTVWRLPGRYGARSTSVPTR
jgi:hypothetical protein